MLTRHLSFDPRVRALLGFLNLSQSSLQNKWFGESVKLIRAVFKLATKLQPAIIFIDEIDSFLRERSSSDHQAHSDMKCVTACVEACLLRSFSPRAGWQV
eukprot:COSAG05_NODE_2713_length_2739_cov_2.401136_4_plen_100_part_00